MTHVTHKIRLGLASLATAVLAAGSGLALAGPASAATYTDTAVQAVVSGTAPVSPVSCGGIKVSGNNSSSVTYAETGAADRCSGAPLLLDRHASHDRGERWICCSDRRQFRYGHLSLDYNDSFCGRSTVVKVVVPDVAGTITTAGFLRPTPWHSIALNHPVNNNVDGTVGVSGTSALLAVAVDVENLPTGLTGGTEATISPGTAIPGTYHFVTEVATDGSGAMAMGEFTLKVIGKPAINQGNLGDEVNVFGNGFDVFQQHYAYNAVIAGWTATKADPATNFVRIPDNAVATAGWQFEAVNGAGIATGLCVSMPGYDAAGTGVATGLVLRSCGVNNSWQDFIPQGDNSLKDAATGLFVNPDGTGAQLRGGAVVTPWGGSFYTWKDHAQLP